MSRRLTTEEGVPEAAAKGRLRRLFPSAAIGSCRRRSGKTLENGRDAIGRRDEESGIALARDLAAALDADALDPEE